MTDNPEQANVGWAKLVDHICNIKPGLPAIMMSGNDAPPEGENGTTASYTYLKKR
jgi:hypothetical protein